MTRKTMTEIIVSPTTLKGSRMTVATVTLGTAMKDGKNKPSEIVGEYTTTVRRSGRSVSI